MTSAKRTKSTHPVNTLDPQTTGPTAYPVAVIVRRQPSNSRWQRYAWRVNNVIIDSGYSDQHGTLIDSSDNANTTPYTDFLWGGFSVTLYKDQTESYYHNLMVAQPQLFVMTRNNAQGELVPFLVSASFDEAQAYEESDEQAHSVVMPATLYPWIERFVLTYYTPEPRKKRKRQRWHESDHADKPNT